jgi:hypothetical protein
MSNSSLERGIGVFESGDAMIISCEKLIRLGEAVKGIW